MSNDDTFNAKQPQLAEQLAELDWDIQPRRDLWPDISSQIRFADRRSQHEQKDKKPWLPFAMAASTVIAVVSLVFSSMSYQYAQDMERHQATLVMYQQAQIELIEQQHKMVRVQFAKLLENEQNNLSPDFVAEVRLLMMNVDEASAEIKEAIKLQPNNPDYASMLVRTYQQEIKLLHKVEAKTAESSDGISI
ncbi:MAG: hypothetical protein AAF431_19660 [Pseudomonadota bacterium]